MLTFIGTTLARAWFLYFSKQKTNMTDNDKKLITKAQNAFDSWEVEKLIPHAESENSREMLHNIAVDIYHREEFYADML